MDWLRMQRQHFTIRYRRGILIHASTPNHPRITRQFLAVSQECPRPGEYETVIRRNPGSSIPRFMVTDPSAIGPNNAASKPGIFQERRWGQQQPRNNRKTCSHWPGRPVAWICPTSTSLTAVRS